MWLLPYLCTCNQGTLRCWCGDDTQSLCVCLRSYIHQQERAAMVRDQLFPHEPLPGHEVPGDRAVITLSEMLVNELPTQDPRWGDTSTRGEPHVTASPQIAFNRNTLCIHVYFPHPSPSLPLYHPLYVPPSLPPSPDISTTSGSSLIIIYQLEDKLEAHRKYLHFLTDTSILDKVWESCTPTAVSLSLTNIAFSSCDCHWLPAVVCPCSRSAHVHLPVAL